mmetsp:Transcript_6417/g.7640  ORF Transcript_6417/g.7640 Transcript_6417/m.7640 type:complete len:382 (+) Transcript_6417:132-1277(+)
MVGHLNKISLPINSKRNVMQSKEHILLSVILEAPKVMEKCLWNGRDDLATQIQIQVIKSTKLSRDYSVSILKKLMSEIEVMVNNYRENYFTSAALSQELSTLLDRTMEFKIFDYTLTEYIKRLSPMQIQNPVKIFSMAEFQIHSFVDSVPRINYNSSEKDEALQLSRDKESMLLWMFLPINFCLKKLRTLSQTMKWDEELRLCMDSSSRTILNLQKLKLHHYEVVADSAIFQLCMLDIQVFSKSSLSLTNDARRNRQIAIGRKMISMISHESNVSKAFANKESTSFGFVTINHSIHAINSKILDLNNLRKNVFFSNILLVFRTLVLECLHDYELMKRLYEVPDNNKLQHTAQHTNLATPIEPKLYHSFSLLTVLILFFSDQ